MRLPARLLRRNVDSYKGDFGHIFIIAGSLRYSGAAVLCSEAAMRSGAGLVTLGIPASLNNALIKIKPKEVMTLPLSETGKASLGLAAYKKIAGFIKQADIIAIGPGIGRRRATLSLVRKIIGNTNKTIVLDADGIIALSGHLRILKPGSLSARRIIITPHLGEMSAITGKSVNYIKSHRKEIAKKFSQQYGLTLVLKGYRTQISDFLGNFYENSTGNPGMATAGSGDVLTGVIASFLGQGLDVFEAAKYAVYLHGLAGDLAAKEKSQLGLIASDIIDKLPEAIKRCS